MKITGKLPKDWEDQVKDTNVFFIGDLGDNCRIKQTTVTAKKRRKDLIDRTIEMVFTTDSIDYDTDNEDILDMIYDNICNLKAVPNFCKLGLEGDELEIIEDN
jgi:hypothetical protein